MSNRGAVLALLVLAAAVGCSDHSLTEPELTSEPQVAPADEMASWGWHPEPPDADPVCETLTFNYPPFMTGQQVMTAQLETLGLDLDVSSTSWVNGPFTYTYPFVFSTDLDPTLWEDNDLLWRDVGGQVGICDDCEGQQQILVIADERGFSAGGAIEGWGDSRYGGEITFDGFPSDGNEYYIESFKVIDNDEYPGYTEPSVQLVVDGSVVGESVPGPDGNVQTVDVSENSIDGSILFRIGRSADAGASAGIDDIVVCRQAQKTEKKKLEGCSEFFWKYHKDDWEPTGLSPDDMVTSVFDIPGHAFDDMTLRKTLGFKGGWDVRGKTRILLRVAVAALLNARHPDVDYKLTADEIIEKTDAALDRGKWWEIVILTAYFAKYNSFHCPLK